jgi:DNA-binding NtrC family response regulator
MQALHKYDWPGNVRELENVVERAAILCRQDLIRVADLPPALRARSESDSREIAPVTTIRDLRRLRRKADNRSDAILERSMVLAALKENRGSITKAAEQLGISRVYLHQLIKKHGLKRTDYAAPDR